LKPLPKSRNVICADGSRYPADVLDCGRGCHRQYATGQRAGLNCDNGIVVGWQLPHQRPSDLRGPGMQQLFSHRYQARVRLESVDNAIRAEQVAALKNMLDKPVAYDRIPWFWSDQYDTSC